MTEGAPAEPRRRRILAEGVAIVVSILLAFAIDAWWEEFQDDVDTRENLVDVQAEFRTYEAELRSRRALWNEYEGSMGRLLAATVSGVAPQPAVMDTLVHDLTWASTFDPGTGALDALIASGRLEFLDDLQLRSSLAAWKGVAEEVRDNEVLARDFITLVLMPYLARAGVPVSRSLALGRDWPEAHVPDAEADRAYRAILGDPEFRAHVAHRYSILNLGEYDEALDFVGGLLERLEREVGPG
jgi:hypothetical protein